MEASQIWVKSMETKQAIRKEIFRRRKEADREQVKRNSHQIFLKLQNRPEYKKAEWIYLYIDCKNEVMTGEILEDALRQGKRIGAPRVEGTDMKFYEITSQEDLEPGYFGIQEPKQGQPEAKGEQGLLLMPGVAFDRECRRVGYGGGFYDRYLEKHREHEKIALAFEFQMMEEVPAEPTDILPDLVLTEAAVYQ